MVATPLPKKPMTLTAAAYHVGRSERQFRRMVAKGLVSVNRLRNGRVTVAPAEVKRLRKLLVELHRLV